MSEGKTQPPKAPVVVGTRSSTLLCTPLLTVLQAEAHEVDTFQ